MTWLLMAVVLTALAAGAWRLMQTALRYGHLLVLREPRGASLYERQADGRYAPLPVVQLPAALRRFTRGTPAEARARARGPRDGR